jgi:hypothetical protein
LMRRGPPPFAAPTETGLFDALGAGRRGSCRIESQKLSILDKSRRVAATGIQVCDPSDATLRLLRGDIRDAAKS